MLSCSAVTTFAPAPLTLPASHALSQLRGDCVDMPGSWGTTRPPTPPIAFPPATGQYPWPPPAGQADICIA